MKIFYAAQATGNGHISRLIELYPYLRKYGEVDVMLSGSNSTLDPGFPVTYRSNGLSMFYTCNGGLNYVKTLSASSLRRVAREARDLPIEQYDLVINDFDSITSLACKKKQIPSIHFGHQASFLSPHTPRPQRKSLVGEWILKNYAQASVNIGLHFKPYDDFILPPVIKKEIWQAQPSDQGHITVYLPSYCDHQLIKTFSKIKEMQFQIFSRQATEISRKDHISLFPVSKRLFDQSLVTCHGIICGAGFETPSEALYLKKKILAIPIRGQYEQRCNAEALRLLGVPVLEAIDHDFYHTVLYWLNTPALPQRIHFAPTREILHSIFETLPAQGYKMAG